MRQPFGETLVAGDCWNWTVRAESAPGSTLKYLFRGPAGQSLDLVAAVGSDGACNFISPSSAGVQSTLALAGDISWGLFLYDSNSNRTELARGTVTVLPDIESAGQDFDGRSWAKRSLDLIKNVSEGRIGRVEESYQIGGRHIVLMKPAELLELQGNIQAIYDRELDANGQRRRNGNQIRVGFGRGNGRLGEWR